MAIDMGSIGALISSVQAAAEITKGMIGLRDQAMLQSKVIELQGVILSAQSSALTAQQEQFSLLQRVKELEQQIASMEAWEAEKRRYALKEVYPGAFAYVLKPEAADNEPPHWLCAACYQRGRKAVLQAHGRDVGQFHGNQYEVYKCPECDGRIRVSYTYNPRKPWTPLTEGAT